MWSKYTVIRDELDQLNDLIMKSITSRNKLLTEIVSGLVASGGKRLRPAFVIIASKFGSYDRKKVLPVAGAFEILHTATLVHDDVVDRSKMRRGQTTVSEKYGSDMAIYTGDFLLSKAVLMMSKGIPNDRLEIVARAIKTICEGEVDQYEERNKIDTSILSYLKRISRKTAVLFSSACGLGAYLGKCTSTKIQKLSKFGFYYGMAFQIRDDINDFISDAISSGKPVGNDIAKGNITLPVIYAVSRDSELKSLFTEAMKTGKELSEEELRHIAGIISKCGALEDSRKLLEKYIDRGIGELEKLPDNECKAAFTDLIKELDIPIEACII